mmetsp:Transcript_30858/g.48357  ORF Transcript_30858/g.48357 Transcript_30858/m.48357 type:complete len:91 (-) Transcript_30858:854-1126(-)
MVPIDMYPPTVIDCKQLATNNKTHSVSLSHDDSSHSPSELNTLMASHLIDVGPFLSTMTDFNDHPRPDSLFSSAQGKMHSCSIPKSKLFP